MVLKFCQEVIGSYFHDDKSEKSEGKTRCEFGWTTSKGQQGISYSVDSIETDNDNVVHLREQMPYVTEEMEFVFSTEQVNDKDGKPLYEPCVLHDYNIGKFGELSVDFRICDVERFEVRFPVDMLKPDEVKEIKAGSKWYVGMNNKFIKVMYA